MRFDDLSQSLSQHTSPMSVGAWCPGVCHVSLVTDQCHITPLPPLHDTQGPGQCHSPKFVTAWLLTPPLTPHPDWHWPPGLCRDLTQDTKRWLWTVNRSRDRLARLWGHTQDWALQPFHGTQTRRRSHQAQPSSQLGNNFTVSHDSNWAQLSNSIILYQTFYRDSFNTWWVHS